MLGSLKAVLSFSEGSFKTWVLLMRNPPGINQVMNVMIWKFRISLEVQIWLFLFKIGINSVSCKMLIWMWNQGTLELLSSLLSLIRTCGFGLLHYNYLTLLWWIDGLIDLIFIMHSQFWHSHVTLVTKLLLLLLFLLIRFFLCLFQILIWLILSMISVVIDIVYQSYYLLQFLL